MPFSTMPQLDPNMHNFDERGKSLNYRGLKLMYLRSGYTSSGTFKTWLQTDFGEVPELRQRKGVALMEMDGTLDMGDVEDWGPLMANPFGAIKLTMERSQYHPAFIDHMTGLMDAMVLKSVMGGSTGMNLGVLDLTELIEDVSTMCHVQVEEVFEDDSNHSKGWKARPAL